MYFISLSLIKSVVIQHQLSLQKNARLIRPGQNVVFGWAKTSEFDNNSRTVVVIGSQHVKEPLSASDLRPPYWQGADFPPDTETRK
jgi:hypothetical protein